MPTITRREQLKLLALSALAPLQAPPAPRPGSGQAVPASGIGRRIRHLSYSDQGGRPDGVQVMVNRRHVYVGHMFSDGVTILDAADPRQLKPVGFFTAGVNTRTHHLQVADDLMLLANGANIVAMQSYDNLRGYFENKLADSITNRKKFRSGLSIHDISRPGEMREIAFLEIPGFGINRLWWTGGRYAYVSAHFDGFTDHILCIVDLNDITKPEIVSRWWLPGMHRAGGEKPTPAPGRRVALHHMLDRRRPRLRRMARRRPDDSRHQRPVHPEAALAHQLVAAVSRRHAYGAAAAGPQPRRRGRRGQRRESAPKGRSTPSSSTCARRRIRCRSRRCRRRRTATSARRARSVRTTCTRTGRARFRSEETIFATYNNAGVRVFDIKDAFAPKEIAYWVPPAPKRLIDPRPNVALAAEDGGHLRHDRRTDVRQRLERRPARAAVRGLRTPNAQLPIPNYSRLPTPKNSQLLEVGSWVVVGRWESGVGI